MPLNLKKSDSSFTGLHALLFLILCAMFYHPSLWCCGASEWKVPTTFIYGFQDWMNYQGAQEARKHMKVPCEIIRIPQVYLFPFPLIWSYFLYIMGTKKIFTCCRVGTLRSLTTQLPSIQLFFMLVEGFLHLIQTMNLFLKG